MIDNSDEYADYEALFDPMRVDRQARRMRKPKAHHTPRKTTEEIIDEVADVIGLEGGFNTTYQPSRYEEGWLVDSLREFYARALISDVLMQVKGGKEASVYVCTADPSLKHDLLAVKVYRPSRFRALTNDAMYREGRMILDSDGHDVMGNNRRDQIARAIGKKTRFGRQVSHTSWLMHEFTALQTLHAAGLNVPEPVQVAENAILMGYFGDAAMAAPTLNTVRLPRAEAWRHFSTVMRAVDVMLAQGMIHGDLSAYNLLYWEGKVALIDFPQVVDIYNNSNAAFILTRDVRRVCDYFSRQGVDCDADALAANLINRYLGLDSPERRADLSRLWDDMLEEE